MEMWSPYASNYDNPITYSDPLGDEGDECCGLLKRAWNVAFGTVAGATVGTFDNLTGSNLRTAVKDNISDPDMASGWNSGLDGADAGAVVIGHAESTGGLGLIAGSFNLAGGTGGLSLEVSAPGIVAGALMSVHGRLYAGIGGANLASQNGRINNPYGSKGKPDHQQKVNELEKKAQSETKPGERVIRERKIQGQDSRKRPDVQIVNRNGKARKVFEAERKPTSNRNIKREKEYKKLGVEQETHKVGNN